MGSAYRCDHCDEHHDGEPHEKLYNKIYIDRQGTDHPLRAELCQSCSENFAGGPPDHVID